MRRQTALCLATIGLCAAAPASPPSPAFPTPRNADEAAILAIIKDVSSDRPNPHLSPTLDWENAFGIRYSDLKKRDAFYGEVVKPLQTSDTDTTLEVKLKFIRPDIAVADEYWHVIGQLDVTTRKPGPDRWGRTTYVFTRQNNQWTEILERVADLRYAYYHHYETMPKPVPVPAATLASYAGHYAFTDTHQTRTIATAGDHLTIASLKHTRIAIPASPTNFLVFDPNDLAEYTRLIITPHPKAAPTATLQDEAGDILGTLVKLK